MEREGRERGGRGSGYALYVTTAFGPNAYIFFLHNKCTKKSHEKTQTCKI